MNEVESQLSLEQLPHEAWLLPLLLPRGFGHFPRFLLGGEGSVRWLDRRCFGNDTGHDASDRWGGESGIEAATHSVQHQVDDVLPAVAHEGRILGVAPHARKEGAGVDERKPAEREDGQDELLGITLVLDAEAEFIGDGRHRLMNGTEMRRKFAELASTLKCFPLQKPHEVRMATDEIEVLADGAGENHLGWLTTLERAFATALHGVADLPERSLQYRAIELCLAAEEIGRGAAGDPGSSTYFLEAGALVSSRREQPLGRIKDRLATSGRIPPPIRCRFRHANSDLLVDQQVME